MAKTRLTLPAAAVAAAALLGSALVLADRLAETGILKPGPGAKAVGRSPPPVRSTGLKWDIGGQNSETRDMFPIAQGAWSCPAILAARIGAAEWESEALRINLAVERVLRGSFKPGPLKLPDLRTVRICCVRTQRKRVSDEFARGERVFIFLYRGPKAWQIQHIQPFEQRLLDLYDVSQGKKPVGQLSKLLALPEGIDDDALYILDRSKRPEVAAAIGGFLHDEVVALKSGQADAARSTERIAKFSQILSEVGVDASMAGTMDDLIDCLSLNKADVLPCIGHSLRISTPQQRARLRPLLLSYVVQPTETYDYMRQTRSVPVLAEIADRPVIDSLIKAQATRPFTLAHAAITECLRLAIPRLPPEDQERIKKSWWHTLRDAYSKPAERSDVEQLMLGDMGASLVRAGVSASERAELDKMASTPGWKRLRESIAPPMNAK